MGKENGRRVRGVPDWQATQNQVSAGLVAIETVLTTQHKPDAFSANSMESLQFS